MWKFRESANFTEEKSVSRNIFLMSKVIKDWKFFLFPWYDIDLVFNFFTWNLNFFQNSNGVNLTNNLGETALHLAAKCYDNKNLEEILKLNPNVFLKNHKNQNAYEIAIECKHEEHAEILEKYAKNVMEHMFFF